MQKIRRKRSSQESDVLDAASSRGEIGIHMDSRGDWLVLLRTVRKEFTKCVILLKIHSFINFWLCWVFIAVHRLWGLYFPVLRRLLFVVVSLIAELGL